MLLIADTSPLISLLLINKLDILEKLFPGFKIPQAVWQELNNHSEISIYHQKIWDLSDKVCQTNFYLPVSGIGSGETECILLYRQLNANFLLIDDKKARQVAESFEINCIGTLGLLLLAKENGLITELRPLFEILISKNRYFSMQYLNIFLQKANEQAL